MHINPCAPLVQDLHAHLSFCSGFGSPFLFSPAPSQAVSACVQYLLRALTPSGADEAPCSGSSRHPSTVSKARFSTVYRWSSFSGTLPLRVYPFSCAVVRLRRMMFLMDQNHICCACLLFLG